MTIKTKLTEKDFIRSNLRLFYEKIIFRVIFVIVLTSLLISFVSEILSPKSSLASILFPIIFPLALAAVVFFFLKKNYAVNRRMSETIEYVFDDSYLRIIGESFQGQLSWDKIHKVTRTKKWIFIWQNPQSANVIPIKDIWEGDITSLKFILEKHKVKNNL